MKLMILIFGVLLAQFSFADLKESIKKPSPALIKIAKALKGHTLMCGTPNQNWSKEIANPIFSLKMLLKSDHSLQITMHSLDRSGEVGFGGEELVSEECSYQDSWMILSIGDDGRKTYLIQNPKEVDYQYARCGSDRMDTNLIASTTIAMDGMVSSTGMNCCFE